MVINQAECVGRFSPAAQLAVLALLIRGMAPIHGLLLCQDPGPDKLYSTLRRMTFRSFICAFWAVAWCGSCVLASRLFNCDCLFIPPCLHFLRYLNG
ncbi:hypothetical protein V8E54_012896 [Elaphomyces granulatus]